MEFYVRLIDRVLSISGKSGKRDGSGTLLARLNFIWAIPVPARSVAASEESSMKSIGQIFFLGGKGRAPRGK